jgi:hypothetical protein
VSTRVKIVAGNEGAVVVVVVGSIPVIVMNTLYIK